MTTEQINPEKDSQNMPIEIFLEDLPDLWNDVEKLLKQGQQVVVFNGSTRITMGLGPKHHLNIPYPDEVVESILKETKSPNPYRVGRGVCIYCKGSKLDMSDASKGASDCEHCHGTSLGPSLAERLGDTTGEWNLWRCAIAAMETILRNDCCFMVGSCRDQNGWNHQTLAKLAWGVMEGPEN